jgi:mevalonate kinase
LIALDSSICACLLQSLVYSDRLRAYQLLQSIPKDYHQMNAQQVLAQSKPMLNQHTDAGTSQLRIQQSASGKIILCGEHAVVYGRPAIALPLADVRAHAIVHNSRAGSGVTIDAPDLERRWTLADSPDHPLSELITSIFAHLGIATPPDLLIEIESKIPIAGGMGSGAAIATALVRALAVRLGHDLSAAEISALVYTSEQRFHGTPSGIDNTVIAYEQPIWFMRARPSSVVSSQLPVTTSKRPRTVEHKLQTTNYELRTTIELITIAAPFTLLIGDTGLRSPTHLPVGEVRQRWQTHPAFYETLFDAVGELVVQARAALALGDLVALGRLIDQNHALLVQIGVSSTELDRLVGAARAAGALGAKLSGAGWGGIMIALVTPTLIQHVAQALRDAGAARVLETTIAYYAIDSQQEGSA